MSKSRSSNLPPPRKSRDFLAVSKPLSHTRIDRLIYLLVFVSAILTAYYSWRAFQWKTQLGGWWNIVSGRAPSSFMTERTVTATTTSDAWQTHHGMWKWKTDPESVEDRINSLAEALGVPKKELASAIAGVVRSHVSPTGPSSDTTPVAPVTSVESLFGNDGE
jgi:hypothetical protein